MRQIKFRGISISDNKFCYGYLSSNRENFYIGEHGEHYNFQHVKQETVGQFTGLTDKNGAEICEGDIVRIDNQYNSFCEFTYASFFLNQGEIRLNLQFYLKHQLEVIGNIHQTPDLLT